MAAALDFALARFIADCPYVVAIQDLITKWRLELTGGYLLDFYFNEAIGKYSYTLILAGTRVMGWDNARHHADLPNYPHHFHAPDGTVQASELTGIPEEDLNVVRLAVEDYLRSALATQQE